jgi:hypothetical protein
MSLTERHRWCMNKILEAFSPDLTMEMVQSFIRNDANLQKFNAFFRGDSTGRLFIYYQPAELTEGEVVLVLFIRISLTIFSSLL